MNPRMREPFHTLIWKASIGYNDSWSLVDPEVLEKFAELIVRECAEVMVNDPLLSDVKSAARGCARSIKQHFGIEE